MSHISSVNPSAFNPSRPNNASQRRGSYQPDANPSPGPTDDPTGAVLSTSSGFRPYVTEIEDLINDYREDKQTKFDIIPIITRILDGDATLTEHMRKQSITLYLTEIDSIEPSPSGPHRIARNEPPSAHERLARHVAKRKRAHHHNNKSSESDDSPSSSNSDSSIQSEDHQRKRRRLRSSQLPWNKTTAQVSKSPGDVDSYTKSAKTIRLLNKDIKSAKLDVSLKKGAPRGIPPAQWEHIFKGEPVDLDRVLSSFHRVSVDAARRGRIGRSEIEFGEVEAKRKVETASEWSSAWRAAAKATAFVFAHREQELFDYGDYIERLFAAKLPSAHSQVILFDKGVRSEVGGGTSILLTDYHQFQSLHAATLQYDGIEYHRPRRVTDGANGGRLGEGSSRTVNSAKTETCHRFNLPVGCQFTDVACRYLHVCESCGQQDHGTPNCKQSNGGSGRS